MKMGWFFILIFDKRMLGGILEYSFDNKWQCKGEAV